MIGRYDAPPLVSGLRAKDIAAAVADRIGRYAAGPHLQTQRAVAVVDPDIVKRGLGDIAQGHLPIDIHTARHNGLVRENAAVQPSNENDRKAREAARRRFALSWVRTVAFVCSVVRQVELDQGAVLEHVVNEAPEQFHGHLRRSARQAA